MEILSKLFSVHGRYISITLISTIAFLTLRYILPKCTRLPEALQKKQLTSHYHWFNILVSLCHSAITGTWCLICFYYDPHMAEDLINGHEELAHTLVAVSTGYFLYDTIDNLLCFPLVKCWEILLHHVVVTSCFGLSVVMHQYIGYAVVALLVEVNSVFLHLRQLCRMAEMSYNNRVYRVNCILNLGTFVVFRICTLTWMTRWLVLNRNAIPQPFHGIGSVGMCLMTVMNSVLFFRLLYKDCFGHDVKKCTQAKNSISNNKQNGASTNNCNKFD